jgi:spore germination protein GerM
MTKKRKNKDKIKGKDKPKARKKAKAALSKSKTKKSLKKAKHISIIPFVIIIMLLLCVIAFLLLRKTGNNDNDTQLDAVNKSDISSDISIEKHKENVDKKTKTSKTEKNSSVQLWFLRLNEKTENISLIPVKRNVSDEGKIENTLKALIDGPSADENARGCLTAVPANLKVRSIKVKDSVAEIDFSAAIGEAATGNILINRIDQIIYTATQFKEVNGIVISVNGKKQNVIGSDGLSIQGVLSRK